MEGKFSVRLIVAVPERDVPGVALRAAEELNVSILKLSRMLERGHGLLTKPVAQDAALRVADALSRAGVRVEVVPVSWEAVLLFEESRQDRPPSQSVLASGEWPPLVPEVLREGAREPTHPRPAQQRKRPGYARGAALALLAALAGASLLWPSPDSRASRSNSELREVLALGPSLEAGRLALESRNYPEALSQWLPLAEAGEPLAQLGLAWLYGNGLGVERDLQRAMRWLREAALQGEPLAQFELAWLYASGLGIEQDLTEAALWYERAAAQGHAEAQYQTGLAYLMGHGVAQEVGQAASWLAAAAEKGVPDAQHHLGVLLLEGRGVPQDTALAERWLRLANHHGVRAAKPYLDALALAKASVPAPLPADPPARTASAWSEALMLALLGEEMALAGLDAPLRSGPSTPSSDEAPDLFAVARDGTPAQVTAALEHPTPLEQRDIYGQTPLMYAASANSGESVQLLLEAGADVNAQSGAGWSALMYAARDNPAVLGALLAAGADPALQNGDGERAADLLQRAHPALLANWQRALGED